MPSTLHRVCNALCTRYITHVINACSCVTDNRNSNNYIVNTQHIIAHDNKSYIHALQTLVLWITAVWTLNILRLREPLTITKSTINRSHSKENIATGKFCVAPRNKTFYIQWFAWVTYIILLCHRVPYDYKSPNLLLHTMAMLTLNWPIVGVRHPRQPQI